MRLFDQLQSLHGLNSRQRELIEYAALLHDIGWHIGREKHHKHSMYLIENGELKGLLAKTRELKGYFDASYAYVSSMKPKPTTKKKR